MPMIHAKRGKYNASMVPECTSKWGQILNNVDYPQDFLFVGLLEGPQDFRFVGRLEE